MEKISFDRREPISNERIGRDEFSRELLEKNKNKNGGENEKPKRKKKKRKKMDDRIKGEKWRMKGNK